MCWKHLWNWERRVQDFGPYTYKNERVISPVQYWEQWVGPTESEILFPQISFGCLMAVMFLHLPPCTWAQLSMKRAESSTSALITRHDVIFPLPAFFHLTALHSCAFTSMLPSPLSSPPHLSLSLLLLFHLLLLLLSSLSPSFTLLSLLSVSVKLLTQRDGWMV